MNIPNRSKEVGKNKEGAVYGIVHKYCCDKLFFFFFFFSFSFFIFSLFFILLYKIVYRQIWNLSYRVLQVTERQITSQFGKKTKTKTKETTGCKIINRTYKYQKYSVIARYLKVTICP